MSNMLQDVKIRSSAQSGVAIAGWLICAIGAIFYSYEYLLRIAPSVMEDELKQHFHLMAGGFGLLSAIYYYAYVPMQIPVGMLMDRYGPRILLTFACGICVLGTMLFIASDSFFVAASGRFLVGLGSAFAFVGVLKLATIWLPADKMALVSGLASSLGYIGAMVGDNVLGLMVSEMGWQQTLNTTIILGIIISLAIWFFVKNSNTRYTIESDSSEDSVTSFTHSLSGLKSVIMNRQIWINGMYGCLIYLPTTVLAELWGISYLEHAHHLTKQSSSFGNSLMFLGLTIGSPLTGWISDKLRRRKLPMFFGAVGAAICAGILFFVPELSANSVYILMFMLGLFYSTEAIVFAVARELVPAKTSGTAMATTNMIVMLGGMFFQPLVGWVLDLSLKLRQPVIDFANLTTQEISRLYSIHDYQMALLIVPAGIVIAGLLTFVLKETHPSVQ